MQMMYKDQDLLAVKGQITLHNVTSLRARGQELIHDMKRPCKICFADVYATHSVAVSLILCWVRYAKAYNKEIRLIHLPSKLRQWLVVIDVLDVIATD